MQQFARGFTVKFRNITALLLLLTAMSSLGIPPPSPYDRARMEHRRSPTVDEASAIDACGLRLSIGWLAWEDHLLKGGFRLEFVESHGFPPGHGWGFLHLWLTSEIVFYDASGVAMDGRIPFDGFHDVDFLLRKVHKECFPFAVKVPPRARFVAAQLGTSEWYTKKVAIPQGGRGRACSWEGSRDGGEG